MLRDIYLHGASGRRFGRHWQLDIVSPAEAVRALCTLRPGLERDLKAGMWRVIVGTPRLRNAIELEHVGMNAGSQAIHIVPATKPQGEDATAVGKIIVGVALVASVFIFPATMGVFLAGSALTGGITLGSVAFSVGTALILGGVSTLLTPRLQAAQAVDMARPEDRPSFLFNGAVNNTQQGGPVPIVLGTHLVGSVLVSGSLNSQDISP